MPVRHPGLHRRGGMHDDEATLDDGSCIEACNDESACNYTPQIRALSVVFIQIWAMTVRALHIVRSGDDLE